MTKLSSNLILGVTFLLGIGLAFWQLYGEQLRNFFPNYAPAPVSETILRQENGSLALTLKPLDPADAHAGVYSYSFDTNQLSVVDTRHDFFAPSFSTDNRTAVVTESGGTDYGLYIAQNNSRRDPELFIPPSPAITAGASQWSKDNMHIVYEARTALPSVDDISIANSRIVLGDTSTSTNKQVILDTGTSPLFQNNGSILYLKEDGVYRMTTNSMSPSAPERILYFDGYTVTTQSRIALSPDEKYLAVTNPATPHLDVYKIMHPESADVVPVRVLSETNIAFWPVFSPDSKSLAYIRYAFNGAGQVAGKNISVYDLNTGTSRVLFDLTSFADDYLSLTSWTTK